MKNSEKIPIGLIGTSLLGSWGIKSWNDRTEILTRRDELLRDAYIKIYGKEPEDEFDLELLRDDVNSVDDYWADKKTDFVDGEYITTINGVDVTDIESATWALWGSQWSIAFAVLGTYALWRMLYPARYSYD